MANKVGNAKFTLVGDVSKVLKGSVDSQSISQVDLTKIAYALGAGCFSEPMFFGETLILNHIAWGTIVSKKGEVRTEKQSKILPSPFLLGIEIQNPPPTLNRFESISALELFEEQAQNFSLGFAFVADAVFGVFEGSYLKRSPIFHEEINRERGKYWENPQPLEDVQAFLFGVVLSEKGKSELPKIHQAFYQNPNEKVSSRLVSHTHAALCERHNLPTDFGQLEQQVTKTPIHAVRHFLTQSVFKEGVFSLFNLTA